MADVVDMAAEIEAERIARGLARVSPAIPAGVSGECEGCGEIMGRLVGGRCGFCRDGRLPPPDWEPPAPTGVPRPTPTLPPSPKRKEPAMHAKSIQLPAYADTAIRAVEAHAKNNNMTIGAAAAALIDRAIAAPAAPGAVPTEPVVVTLDGLFDQLRALFDEQVDGALGAAIARAEAAEAAAGEARTEADAAAARAEAAEAAVARIKAALA